MMLLKSYWIDSNVIQSYTYNSKKKQLYTKNFSFFIYEYRTYKQKKKLQSPGALNTQVIPGHKQKENLKK